MNAVNSRSRPVQAWPTLSSIGNSLPSARRPIIGGGVPGTETGPIAKKLSSRFSAGASSPGDRRLRLVPLISCAG